MKDKQIWLLDGHKIPPLKELKRKIYCKWHNSFSNATSNCIVFKKFVQKTIKEGRFKLPDKGLTRMKLDTNLFPIMEDNMVSFSGPNQPDAKSKGKGKKAHKPALMSR